MHEFEEYKYLDYSDLLGSIILKQSILFLAIVNGIVFRLFIFRIEVELIFSMLIL